MSWDLASYAKLGYAPIEKHTVHYYKYLLTAQKYVGYEATSPKAMHLVRSSEPAVRVRTCINLASGSEKAHINERTHQNKQRRAMSISSRSVSHVVCRQTLRKCKCAVDEVSPTASPAPAASCLCHQRTGRRSSHNVKRLSVPRRPFAALAAACLWRTAG